MTRNSPCKGIPEPEDVSVAAASWGSADPLEPSGKVKEKWGKLTGDDLAQIKGKREQLEGKIQERYGHAEDQVKNEVDDWHRNLK